MRVSVQLRAPGASGEQRWQRSVYADSNARLVSIAFDDMRPAGDGSSAHPPLEAVDFRHAHERARQQVNAWVAKETADRIRDLVPPGAMDPDTRLALVNALYLLADWQQPFTAEATRPSPAPPGTGCRRGPRALPRWPRTPPGGSSR